MSGAEDDVVKQPPRKKRGPYKTYLLDPTKPIPRTTLLYTSKSICLDSGGSSSKNADDNEIDPQEILAEEENVCHSWENVTNIEAAFEDINSGQGFEAQLTTSGIAFKEDEKQKKRSYADKHNLNNLLHQESSLTKIDVLLMILHLSIRHCNTQHFIEDQIKFVNTIFGTNVLDVSYHVFSTLFKPTIKFSKHYFCESDQYYLGSEDEFWSVQCPTCKKIIDEEIEDGQVQCVDCDFLGSKEKYKSRVKAAACPECNKQIDVFSVNSGNYFVTLPLRDQIEELLKKPGLKLLSRAERPPTSAICDVFDGAIYKKLSQPGYPLANENALTVIVNTDGVAIHKSTKNTLWPIWLHLNEIVPEQRFKQENLILAGLWFGQSAPNMSLYLKPFMKSILDVSLNGVKYKKSDGTEIQCPVYLLTCSVDSVAKPKLLCQKQFNAKMGCLYCFHPNDSTIDGNAKQRYYDQSVNYNVRSEEDVIRDMLEADKLHRSGELGQGSVNGFLGISILTESSKLKDLFPCSPLNLVWGVVIDYLHAVLEGVTADLFNVYENILTADKLKRLDDNIKKITPPRGMTRRPRSFSLRPYWKAKEFRSMILYFAVPCFQELLPNRDFVLLKHFVNVLHILLSDSISCANLDKAAHSLSAFTEGYQRLYGLQNVTYNLHLCRHLVEMVIQQGPLWCYSNFIFESGNGYLAKLVQGTKSVVNEIAKKHTTIQTVQKFISEHTVSLSALSFCSDTIHCNYASLSEEFDGVFVTGSQSYGDVTNEEGDLFVKNNVILLQGSQVQYFNRVIRNGIVYTSKSYQKAKVHDDSCVILRDKMYACIDKIVKSEGNKILCLIKPIRVDHKADLLPTIKTCCHDVFDSAKIVPFSDVYRKCLFLSVGDKSFICHIPNFFERD